jgi:hypothetical protein
MQKLSRWIFPALGMVIGAGALALSAGTTGAQSPPTFSLSPQNQSVALAAGAVQVQIHVANASDAAGFQFKLRYDRGVLGQPTVQAGGMMPGAQCLDPVIDNNVSGETPDPGTIKFACFSGTAVSGSGTLGTVTFQLEGGDHTVVNIEQAILDTTLGDAICNPCAVQNGSITVTGGNASKDTGVGAPPPPPVPQPVSTPQIGGVPVSSNPGASSGGGTTSSGGSTGSGSQPSAGGGSSAGATGTIAGSRGTAGGTAGTSTGGAGTNAARSGGPNTGVGHFGYGPQPSNNHDRRDAGIAGLVMAALGLLSLYAGGATRLLRARRR